MATPPEQPWTIHEKNYLLAEIIKGAYPTPDVLLNLVRNMNVKPRWDDIPLPLVQAILAPRPASDAEPDRPRLSRTNLGHHEKGAAKANHDTNRLTEGPDLKRTILQPAPPCYDIAKDIRISCVSPRLTLPARRAARRRAFILTASLDHADVHHLITTSTHHV
ncbi:uncharacterized protein MYCGRDRAFT_108377 [Zymoseptoria tritici IPO323]|uniref:Uncharacterized protein n=1 Tax=Zymoseptoria tritici (strain CBS 115943 / IPO323) TaxID=336722 RepID=F9X4Z6_ZYMTI|nr:uncharacterized protein MYCGRDRAFT_108377 [Zymoseptoria tritici IPO323]EGP90195.1 hypothetical protein MYCGRDRAFT_108377 [Zymoseptoria tritici IPO323]